MLLLSKDLYVVMLDKLIVICVKMSAGAVPCFLLELLKVLGDFFCLSSFSHV